jgi:hypothetical protein
MLSGQFTAAGTSLAYVPPIANSQYYITVGGTGSFLAVIVQTLFGGAQTLVTDPVGNPIIFAAPGGYQLNMPFTDGSPTPTYNLICKRIGVGSTLAFTFSP